MQADRRKIYGKTVGFAPKNPSHLDTKLTVTPCRSLGRSLTGRVSRDKRSKIKVALHDVAQPFHFLLFQNTVFMAISYHTFTF